MTKKERENKIFFERFKNLYGKCPQGYISGYDNIPDIIIETQNKQNNKLGIEITRIFNDDSNRKDNLKAKENLTQSINDKIRYLLDKTSLPNLDVSIYYYNKFQLSKNNIDKLANDIFNLIVNHIPPSDKSIKIGDDYKNDAPLIPNFKKSVNIINIYRTINHHLVHSDGFVWLKPPDDKIKESIQKKEKLLSSYKKNCNSVWLLIVKENILGSSIFDEIQNKIYKSIFDKVFFLDYSKNKYNEHIIEK